jgi:DNA polymerase III sliding clamp (beta) subunit (PCNA family)
VLLMPVFLPKNLAHLANVAARDSARFAVNALRVHDLGRGSEYRVEATDGKRLAVVRGPCPQAQYPALPDGADTPDVLVPVADWKSAFRLGGKQRPVGLAAEGPTFTLAVGDQSLTGSAPEGRFPDFDVVLPRTPAPIAFTVDLQLLIGLLQAAAALEPAGGVKVLFWSPAKPVGLTAKTAQGQFFDGLLMPLT